MSDPTKEQKPNEELIPKAELLRVQTEAQQLQEALKQQVEEAKGQLLSQEYLEYIEQKKAPKKEQKAGETEEVKALRSQLSELRTAQAELAAHVELEQVRKAHPDFEDYRKDVQKILETSKTDLTIDQAYYMAKGQKEPKPAEKKEEKPDFSSEKPGGIYPPPNQTDKKFKNELDAGMDAATQVMAKYGLSGNTL